MGSSPASLHEVDVTVFADGNCGEMNQYMTPDMLCAGVMEGGKDACQGDSGGPLFISDPANNNAKTLIGAVSWGFGCANPGQLGIYAEVSYFRDWIDSQIPDMNTCGPATSAPQPWTCESSSEGGSGSGTTSLPTTTTTSSEIPSPPALATTALAATVSSRSPSWKWSTLVAQPSMAIQILGAQLSSTRMEFMCLAAVIGNTVEANARQ